MKKIIVGSTNLTKIAAAKQAFEAVWPNERFETEGVKVDSGVSDQPMSFDETIRGAKNRARAAMLLKQADFTVGLEAGLEKYADGWFESGWVAVLAADGNFGLGSSAIMPIPELVMKGIRQGKELGEVIDELTNRTDVKHQEGFFGLISCGTITRTSAFKDGTVLALAPFARPEFFEEKEAVAATKKSG